MRNRKARSLFATLLACVVCTQAFAARASGVGAPSAARQKSPADDWSKLVVESTMKRFPTAESLKGWGYAKSLYLYGQYLVYLRTKDRRYLEHVKAWVDLHVDEKGTINRPINALDYMLPIWTGVTRSLR